MDLKRSRFSEEQIIAVLKEQEAGIATADVCRRHWPATQRRFTIGRPSMAAWRSLDPAAAFAGRGERPANTKTCGI